MAIATLRELYLDRAAAAPSRVLAGAVLDRQLEWPRSLHDDAQWVSVPPAEVSVIVPCRVFVPPVTGTVVFILNGPSTGRLPCAVVIADGRRIRVGLRSRVAAGDRPDHRRGFGLGLGEDGSTVGRRGGQMREQLPGLEPFQAELPRMAGTWSNVL